MNIVLSLDIGTSKIAAVAFACGEQKNIAVLSAENSTTVSGLPAGRHEQEPEKIFNICADLLRQLATCGEFSPENVRSIAISGQMHGVLLADPSLRPLTNLITWCDQLTIELVAALDRSNWPVQRTGCYLHAGYGGATLAEMAKKHEIPANAKALTIADYVVAKLCGTIATDATHAASWGIMDVAGQCWDKELLDRFAIPQSVLPEIKPAMTELGKLSIDLGLPAETTVCLPIGDNQASFIGSCGFANNSVLLNLGTGGQISLPVNQFAFMPELETRPLPFGGYLLVGASLCGGRAYAILKDFFRQTVFQFTGKELSDSELYKTMDRLAETTTAGLDTDTRFAGTRLKPELRGAIAGIDHDNFTPEALCRGMMRGMVRELAAMVPQELRCHLSRVLASGNAVRKSPLAQQMISEELGMSCELSDNSEEAATGAAMTAAKAMNLL